MKKYYSEINITRGIGIILVMLGHAFPDSAIGIESRFARTIFDIIYSFHMPLFIFLAGFVGTKVIDANRKESWNYIKSRAQRLLIPYFVVAICYFPLKIIFSKFANVPYDMKDLIYVFLGKNPNYAMWTLWMLFMIAVVAALFVNTHNLKIVTFIALIVVVIFCAIKLPEKFVGIEHVLNLSFFYFLGIIVARNYDKVKKECKNHKLYLFICIIVFVGTNITKEILVYKDIMMHEILSIFTAISGIGMTVYCAYLISNFDTRSVTKKALDICGKYSMDIYVLGTFIQPFLRIVFWSKLGINYAVYTVFISTIGGVILSVAISKYTIRRWKVTRKLLLGMK